VLQNRADNREQHPQTLFRPDQPHHRTWSRRSTTTRTGAVEESDGSRATIGSERATCRLPGRIHSFGGLVCTSVRSLSPVRLPPASGRREGGIRHGWPSRFVEAGGVRGACLPSQRHGDADDDDLPEKGEGDRQCFTGAQL
jgi:hypothetical protein